MPTLKTPGARAFVLIGASLLPFQAAHARDVVLPPASPWNVDWGRTSCTLARAFGAPDSPLTLRMERFAPGDTFQLTVMGDELSSARTGQLFTVQYGNGAKQDYMKSAMVGRDADGTPVVLLARSGLGATDEARVASEDEAAINRITFGTKSGNITLRTGPMGKAFAALRQCTRAMVARWGLDPDAQEARLAAPRPLGSPDQWIVSDDYPLGSRRMGNQALVSVRLLIDAAGSPTDCEIVRSYADDESFARRTCDRLLANARFTPARGADGAPIGSYWTTSARWVIR